MIWCENLREYIFVLGKRRVNLRGKENIYIKSYETKKKNIITHKGKGNLGYFIAKILLYFSIVIVIVIIALCCVGKK